ncbi:MAG: hypothetical protein ACOYYS_10735 [Chloroflexota bacterium]
MCDYCTEGIAIEVAEAETLGCPWSPELESRGFFKVIRLQETRDFLTAFQAIKPVIEKAISIARTETDFQALSGSISYLHVALCRFVEILVDAGFGSQDYQSCIADATFLEIARMQCQRAQHEPFLENFPELRTFFLPDTLGNQDALATLLAPESSFAAECKAFFKLYNEWRETNVEDANIDGSYNTFLNI